MAQYYASLDDINKILIVRKDSNGKYYIGGIKVPNVLCTQVTTVGTVIRENVTVINSTGAQVTVPSGTLTTPSLSFNSNPGLGFYQSAPNTVSVVSNGVSAVDISDTGVAFNVPVTFSGGSMPTLNVDEITSTGDLSINPAGANIDFNGKNLLNVGGIVLNQYKYTAAGTVTVTTNNTPTDLYLLGIDTNSVMYFTYTVIGANPVNGDAIVYSADIHATNIANTVTLNYQWVSKRAGVLNTTASVAHSVTGTSIKFTVTGLAATTMKWMITFDINKLLL